MEQYIPYSLKCDLFSRNLETYLYLWTQRRYVFQHQQKCWQKNVQIISREIEYCIPFDAANSKSWLRIWLFLLVESPPTMAKNVSGVRLLLARLWSGLCFFCALLYWDFKNYFSGYYFHIRIFKNNFLMIFLVIISNFHIRIFKNHFLTIFELFKKNFTLIWHHTRWSLVPNQLEKCK